MENKKTALVTGATSGIGRSTAIMLAQHGYDLIITGRRNDRLDELKQLIESENRVEVLTLNFDIRDYEATKAAIDGLPLRWKTIDLLVNNAGLAAGLDTIQEGKLEKWEQMIDTNVKGLLYISQLVIPLMIARSEGHIVNIGSIAGKEVYLKGNVYCASKHAVDALTKGMRIDLLPHNIRVSSVSPGAVETEFSIVRFDGDVEAANRVYDGFIPLSPDDIAEAILFVVGRPKHVNINDILIMPTAQGNATTIFRQPNPSL